MYRDGIMFGIFFFFIILVSLFVLWRWRFDAPRLSWWKVALAAGIGSLILFPLGLVFQVDGVCFGHGVSTVSAVVKYGVLMTALCLSMQALNCVIWYGARHEKEWNPWLKRGAMAATVLMMVLLWWYWGTRVSFDFFHRQYPQIISGEYNMMHTLAHTLMCQGILSVWHHFHAVVLVHVALLGGIYFMIFSWGAREKIKFLIVAGAVLLCMVQFEMMTTVIKDVPYSISMMALTIGLCTYMLEKRTSGLWLIGLGLAGAGCLRYDGYVPFFLTVAVLCVYMFRHREEIRRLGVPVAAAVLCWLFTFAVLPLLVNAEKGPSGTRYAKMAHVICDIVAEGGNVSAADMELIEREIMPREIIMSQYSLYRDCLHPVVSAAHGEKYIYTGLFASEEPKMKYGFAWNLSDKGELVRKLFLSVSADNPLRAAKILLLNSQIVWNLPVVPRGGTPQLWLFYGCFLSVLVYGMLKKKSYLIPFVPFYGVAFVIGAAATTYEVRYLLPIELLFPILLLYSIGCARRAGVPEPGAHRIS